MTLADLKVGDQAIICAPSWPPRRVVVTAVTKTTIHTESKHTAAVFWRKTGAQRIASGVTGNAILSPPTPELEAELTRAQNLGKLWSVCHRLTHFLRGSYERIDVTNEEVEAALRALEAVKERPLPPEHPRG